MDSLVKRWEAAVERARAVEEKAKAHLEAAQQMLHECQETRLSAEYFLEQAKANSTEVSGD